MLVLSRKENEEVVIGGKIRVTVVKLGRGRAKLGISAPREVGICRGELAQADKLSAVLAGLETGRGYKHDRDCQ